MGLLESESIKREIEESESESELEYSSRWRRCLRGGVFWVWIGGVGWPLGGSLCEVYVWAVRVCALMSRLCVVAGVSWPRRSRRGSKVLADHLRKVTENRAK